MQEPTVIMYVHGFGGSNDMPAFHRSLQQFFQKHRLPLNIRTFSWNSLPLTPEVLVFNFTRSQEVAKEAGQALLLQMQKFEAIHQKYHLIGFSLGADVIKHALSYQSQPLCQLQSIYFLGAAFNYDSKINEDVLINNKRYYNYHSDNDAVLKVSYFNVTGIYAAGSIGIQKPSKFINLPTQCAHVLIHNYTDLSDAIGFLISWDEGLHIPGKLKYNIAMPTVGGEYHWHTICNDNKYIIQQNAHTGYFRALEDTPAKRRKAWSDNLHIIFEHLAWVK